MTTLARPIELTAVGTSVTSGTLTAQAEVRTIKSRVLSGSDSSVGDTVGSMALATGKIGMFPIERVAGEAVIERLDPPSEMHEVKVTTLVFDMAQDTLAVVVAAMETAAVVLLIGNRRVALEALLGQLVPLRAVAAGAVFDALEERMRTDRKSVV